MEEMAESTIPTFEDALEKYDEASGALPASKSKGHSLDLCTLRSEIVI